MPNFLIVGAAKAGTTSLYSYLKQHPQIYMSPVKETNFFAFEGAELNFLGGISQGYLADFKTNIDDYRAQFQGVNNEIAIGEASPSYLYLPKAVARIKYYIPEVKIIVILRNPIERAYSHFLHHLRDRLVDYRDFEQALDAEAQAIADNWWWDYHYIQVGLYYQQLKRYFANFKQEQIKVWLYEDLTSNPLALIQDICQFLGVERQFAPDMAARLNATGVPRYRTLDALIKEPNLIKTVYQLLPAKLRQPITAQINQRNPLKKPPLLPHIRQHLLGLYREDILQLQQLIQRDLSGWLQELNLAASN
ncbi:MAG: sulfotransferase [Cyanobacteria bacterium P01_A01_bin.40]